MPFDICVGILRRIIAKGDMNGILLAERAINEYWDTTPEKARKSGLRLIQQNVLQQRMRSSEINATSPKL